MSVVGVIPARLQSSRLPSKLLLAETGKPLIQHTWEAAVQARSLDSVVIATDSEEIRAACEGFGARCELTGDHPSGTDRIAELVRRSYSDSEIVINVQGDEPELDALHIDLLVDTLRQSDASMATLAIPMTERREIEDPSCTKVVVDGAGAAMYFSRAPIPHVRDGIDDKQLKSDSPYLLHIGVYAFRTPTLLELTELPPSRFERLEKLEQLRALEAGISIQVATVDHRSVGVDTREDYESFKARYLAGE